MKTARTASLLAIAGLTWSLAAQAAEGDQKPAPAAPVPAAQPPAAKPPSADQTDYSKEQERAVKPPTDASMGAVDRRPESPEEPGKKK